MQAGSKLCWSSPVFYVKSAHKFQSNLTMTKKAAKATRKFAAKGQLKKTIQVRRKHQQFKKKIRDRRGRASGPKPEVAEEDDSELDGKEKTQR
jgi:hypothetical protein